VSLGGHHVAFGCQGHSGKKAKEWGSVTSTGSYKQSNMLDWLMGLLGSWETKAHRMR